jgi:penicillin-insensitive murein DD-endopeptidase
VNEEKNAGGRRLAALVALAASVAVVLIEAAATSEPRGGSVSVGHANDGALRDGVRLPDTATGLVSISSSRVPEPKYGTTELVAAILEAAAEVARLAPGPSLHVGDLSVQGGGPTAGHESHQAGRDADLLFFMLDAAGLPTRSRAARFDGAGLEEGAGADARRFDTARNWIVLRSLVENRHAHLQRVLVSEPLRALLLAHARSIGEPAWIVERAGEVTCDSWSSHDNHFHVRVFCTAEDYRQGCRDEDPVYTWRRTELAARGIINPELAEDPNRHSREAVRWLATSTVDRPWCP